MGVLGTVSIVLITSKIVPAMDSVDSSIIYMKPWQNDTLTRKQFRRSTHQTEQFVRTSCWPSREVRWRKFA